MKINLVATIATLLVLFFLNFEVIAFPVGKWYCEQNANPRSELFSDAVGTITARMVSPGSLLMYQEFNRRNFRLSYEDYMRVRLSLELAVSGSNTANLHAVIFIKDKDGLWFQSHKELVISGCGWQKFEVDLSSNFSLVPVGHAATWNSQYLASASQIGISLYSSSPGEFTVLCRNMIFGGKREFQPLSIINFQMPDAMLQNQMLQGTFMLSRDYYNPYDTDEIEVNLEVVRPDGITDTVPVFFAQDFSRRRHFTREINLPIGGHYWAFRYTPRVPGKFLLRLTGSDRYGGIISSDWRELICSSSNLRGFVGVCKYDKRYFEFSNGDFFFPIGINIHTNIDLRSERQFKFGHLPDRGTYDYDDYWNGLAANGVNAAEIWMASWSFVLEWNSARPYYFGLGRYNLANAWRLDYVLNEAAAKGIYIHLTLDNHGKVSAFSDQEWEDNPFNINNKFSAANAGFIADAEDFFSNAQAIKYNSRRNRYIAARWGAFTNIFGIEFWSEVNLVNGFDNIYGNGVAEQWHRNAAAEFRKFDQGKHMLTTHFCGDYLNLLKYSRLPAMPEFDYVAGDAYRNNQIHFVDQMRQHERMLLWFGKPLLSTEFGGTSMAGRPEQVVGDIHSGIWSSFFKAHAGTPFLWWHDFIHLNNHYRHYRGFAQFIHGIDWRGAALFKELPVSAAEKFRNVAIPAENQFFLVPPFWKLHEVFYAKINAIKPLCDVTIPGESYERDDYFIECMSGLSQQNVYGWVYVRLLVFSYPENMSNLAWQKKVKVKIDYPLPAGVYRLRCYDTISNQELNDDLLIFDNREKIVTLPPFQVDLAFKLERVGPTSQNAATIEYQRAAK